MSPGHKRQIVESLVTGGQCSARAACRHFELHRSTFAYEAKEPDARLVKLKEALRRLSNLHSEFENETTVVAEGSNRLYFHI